LLHSSPRCLRPLQWFRRRLRWLPAQRLGGVWRATAPMCRIFLDRTGTGGPACAGHATRARSPAIRTCAGRSAANWNSSNISASLGSVPSHVFSRVDGHRAAREAIGHLLRRRSRCSQPTVARARSGPSSATPGNPVRLSPARRAGAHAEDGICSGRRACLDRSSRTTSRRRGRFRCHARFVIVLHRRRPLAVGTRA